MNGTSAIGLMMLMGVVAFIFALYRQTKNRTKNFWVEVNRQGFVEEAPLPASLQEKYSYLSARRSKLLPDHPEVLLLLGSLKGTSVVTAGGNSQTFDEYLGFCMSAEHDLSGERLAALVKGLPGPPLSVPFAGGSVMLLWQWRHLAANIATACLKMRGALMALPIMEKVSPPPLPVPPAPEPPPMVYVNDNMWGWRKEGDMGLDFLPEEALHPDNTMISMDFHMLPEISPRIGTLKKLKSLRIFNTELSALPEEIGCCENLRRIDIRQCKLERLPDSIGALPHLEVLNLSHNHINALPTSFGKLKTLRELCLNANPFTSLDESIGELERLETLEVACVRLASLPESIKRLPRLRELVLHENGPLAPSIGAWQAALPMATVRFASIIEITPTG